MSDTGTYIIHSNGFLPVNIRWPFSLSKLICKNHASCFACALITFGLIAHYFVYVGAKIQLAEHALMTAFLLWCSIIVNCAIIMGVKRLREEMHHARCYFHTISLTAPFFLALRVCLIFEIDFRTRKISDPQCNIMLKSVYLIYLNSQNFWRPYRSKFNFLLPTLPFHAVRDFVCAGH